MKTVKKLTAILLCIAMLLGIGATSAFALEIGDTIVWNVNNTPMDAYSFEVEYAGTLSEGWTDIEDLGMPYRLAYTFNAEKDGYYVITLGENEYVEAAESFSGKKAANFMPCIYKEAEAEDGDYIIKSFLFNFKKGENLLCVEFDEANPAGTSINIEFFGEKITNVVLFDEYFDCLILDYDWYAPYEGTLDYDTTYNIEFSSGKLFQVIDGYIVFEYDGSFEKGKKTFTADLLGYEIVREGTVYMITDLIESMDASNFNVQAVEYYNGYKFKNADIEKVTVKFTDGTSANITDDEKIALPCGRNISVSSYGSISSAIWYISVAGRRYVATGCEIIKTDFTANAEIFKSEISSILRETGNDIMWATEFMFEADSLEAFFERSGNLFSGIKWCIKTLSNEISLFTKYYL